MNKYPFVKKAKQYLAEGIFGSGGFGFFFKNLTFMAKNINSKDRLNYLKVKPLNVIC